MTNGFGLWHQTDISLIKEDYYLHAHKAMHEILLFITGDCKFRAEGNSYSLHPGDLLLATNNELHEIVHLSETQYERYIINIDTDFFAKNNIPTLGGVFTAKLPGVGNLIPAETVRSSGVYDAVLRMEKYYEAKEYVVARAALIELLYMITEVTSAPSQDGADSGLLQSIVSYINENIREELKLAELADQFHISLSHAERLFKKQMKMPIKKYITYKRLLLASELTAGGMPLLEASMEAGFSSYSSFWRMYTKEFGVPPKKHMKNKDPGEYDMTRRRG